MNLGQCQLLEAARTQAGRNWRAQHFCAIGIGRFRQAASIGRLITLARVPGNQVLGTQWLPLKLARRFAAWVATLRPEQPFQSLRVLRAARSQFV